MVYLIVNFKAHDEFSLSALASPTIHYYKKKIVISHKKNKEIDKIGFFIFFSC